MPANAQMPIISVRLRVGFLCFLLFFAQMEALVHNPSPNPAFQHHLLENLGLKVPADRRDKKVNWANKTFLLSKGLWWLTTMLWNNNVLHKTLLPYDQFNKPQCCFEGSTCPFVYTHTYKRWTCTHSHTIDMGFSAYFSCTTNAQWVVHWPQKIQVPLLKASFPLKTYCIPLLKRCTVLSLPLL